MESYHSPRTMGTGESREGPEVAQRGWLAATQEPPPRLRKMMRVSGADALLKDSIRPCKLRSENEERSVPDGET